MAVKSLIETVTVGAGGASSITFAAIVQESGSDLLCVLSARGGGTGITGAVLSLNADTTNANYTAKQLEGNGASASSNADYPRPIAWIPDSSYTSNTFGNASFYISNYASSAYKSISTDGVSENNATTAYQVIHASTWNDTSAVTSLVVGSSRGGFAEYSTASLYKIKYD